jgi:quaternary ammonium compound-resistance protein SugE
MAWAFLLAAGFVEIFFALSLKGNEGFTRFWPLVYTAALGALSFFLLSKALMQLPVGTAYAVWTGIGAVGVALVGIFFYHEPRDLARLICIALIVVGVVGLKVTGGH